MDWVYEPSQSLDRSVVERLRQFPREPDMLIFGLRSAAAILLRAALRVYNRFEIQGRQNLPLDRSFVMVANHASHLDALAMLSALPLRKLHRAFPAAAQDYFFVDIKRLAVSAVLVNAMPFSRRVNNRQSLAMCQAILENPGNILIIYPEGTRTTTGAMAEFRPGIGMLVAGRDIPVVPCGIVGAYRAWPKGSWIPRPTKFELRIGKPTSFGGLPATKASAEDIAATLHSEVKELLK